MSGSGGSMAPGGPWDEGRDLFSMQSIQNGRSDHASWKRTVKTSQQRLSGKVNMTGYKLQTDAKLHDFYCVFGNMSHGINGYGENVVSVGYYATEMSLTLELQGDENDSRIWDFGPTSTVGESTVNFSIGGNLSGGSFAGEPILQGGVNGSFGSSFSAPDVTIAASSVGLDLRWSLSLPRIGFQSPGNPANPKQPSSAGYQFYFGVIFALKSGSPFHLRVRPNINWEYDYTRGVKNDSKSWSPEDNESNLYTYVGGNA